MSTRSNAAHLVAWRAFLSAHAKVIRLLEEEMGREQGLPLSWFDVLAHLEGATEGRLRMQELAGSLVISRSGLTRLFDRIAGAGLVAREACAEDRRGTYAVITPQGRSVLKRVVPGHFRAVDEHFFPTPERRRRPCYQPSTRERCWGRARAMSKCQQPAGSAPPGGPRAFSFALLPRTFPVGVPSLW